MDMKAMTNVTQENASSDSTPNKIELQDRLRAENLQLKLQNIQLQLQVMHADLQKALQSRNMLVAEMTKLREEFMAKYGVDLATIQIHEDGSYSKVGTQGQTP